MEQRAVIKFNAKLGKSVSETFRSMQQVYGSQCLGRTTVFEWGFFPYIFTASSHIRFCFNITNYLNNLLVHLTPPGYSFYIDIIYNCLFMVVIVIFRHSEVYILILLGSGLIFHIIINERGKKKTFESLGIIYVIITIGFLGFIVMMPLGTYFILIPFIVIIEFISLIIRPFTLAIRLTTNIIAGHLLTLGSSRVNIFNTAILLILISTQILLYILEISVSIIQAYVFSILSTLYSKET
ncbi:ATP6 synthase, partial [Acromyrmex charruanus]